MKHKDILYNTRCDNGRVDVIRSTLTPKAWEPAESHQLAYWLPLNGSKMKIAIASDHAGFEYKQEIIKFLENKGYEVIDFGTDSHESVDYPDFIKPAAIEVSKGNCASGIVLGGSGNGEAIAANKVKGIRCAVTWDIESARLAKEHNDANIISIGQRMVSLETALKIVDTWLSSTFEGSRHIARIEKIEKEY